MEVPKLYKEKRYSKLLNSKKSFKSFRVKDDLSIIDFMIIRILKIKNSKATKNHWYCWINTLQIRYIKVLKVVP